MAHLSIEFLHVKPGKGAANVRTTLRNYLTGNQVEKTFSAGSKIEVTRKALDILTGGKFKCMVQTRLVTASHNYRHLKIIDEADTFKETKQYLQRWFPVRLYGLGTLFRVHLKNSVSTRRMLGTNRSG
ncbi:uncharacterized protein LOC111372430 [Olea europaea var. sylvestris]|uniref:uncharacterized protein LOC111372430 n=1 Tax=Olea europaea var. sylvestris TaxID=158386 RepID=UPI000C1D59D6|nr:uncharacterized protein LOC111372430 [Olea europaea var. sylvestris]